MNPWELIIQRPVINVLIVMAHSLGDSFGWAIIALTVFVNICLLPFTLSQIRSMKAMQELQPHIDKVRTLHKDNPQKLNKELMELYRKYNVNPLGG